MIEAFACGTPVVAYERGSVAEIMQDGVTGFIVNSQHQAIAAARRIDSIDRGRCRDVFERRFTAAKMASRYVQVYQAVIDARATGDPVLDSSSRSSTSAAHARTALDAPQPGFGPSGRQSLVSRSISRNRSYGSGHADRNMDLVPGVDGD
jgi:hypothetical protein